ncbi:MAG: NADH-ubiquinone dehydrogenase [Rhizobiaceae bacterium]|nr:NADH-ubiquinone dehydrogenase [Rhizobiaceae bacterium]
MQSLRSLEAEWSRAGRNLAAVMPKEMAGAFNLMAHPAAMMSASAIVGLGAASHAAGLWMGAWLGAAENMQRMMAAPLGGQASRQAEKRARAAADTLIADAKSLADEVVKPAGKHAARVKRATKGEPTEAKSAQVAAKDGSTMPVAMPKPANPDDLKQISGVGPKLEQVLNKLGIWTYGQIAALTPAEIDWIEDYLSFKGRIGRDGWLDQAVRLAAGREP